MLPSAKTNKMTVQSTWEECDGLSAANGVLTGMPQPVGKFAFWIHGQRWEWSDSVAAMYGYPPGTEQPTTELLLRHIHPDDRPQAAGCLDRVLRGEPFSSRHRLIDAAGRQHVVVIAGDAVCDDDGVVTGVRGFFVDVTAAVEADIDDMVAQWAGSRAQIEQAKGVVMAAYGVDAQRAFNVLVWRSKSNNIKLREFARRFLYVVERKASTFGRGHIEHALLTAHSISPEAPNCATQVSPGTRIRK
jgi:ANTAR domain/PAS fold